MGWALVPGWDEPPSCRDAASSEHQGEHSSTSRRPEGSGLSRMVTAFSFHPWYSKRNPWIEHILSTSTDTTFLTWLEIARHRLKPHVGVSVIYSHMAENRVPSSSSVIQQLQEDNGKQQVLHISLAETSQRPKQARWNTWGRVQAEGWANSNHLIWVFSNSTQDTLRGF